MCFVILFFLKSQHPGCLLDYQTSLLPFLSPSLPPSLPSFLGGPSLRWFWEQEARRRRLYVGHRTAGEGRETEGERLFRGPGEAGGKNSGQENHKAAGYHWEGSAGG